MRLLYLFALLCCLAPLALADDLPDLGDPSRAVLSPQQERALGDTIMRQIRSEPNYLDDSELSQYLNDLGYRLVSHSPSDRQSLHLFVLKDSTINAFALPGGFIGVNSGLILAAQSESELAGVLAHEIGHVVQHHAARTMAHEQASILPSLAALAVAILAARSNPDVASAAIATSQAASIQNQIDYTRGHEREADRIGLQILEKAGFDPRGMVTFFERLQKDERLYATGVPAFLRDHPLTAERIADLENRIANLPYRQVPDSIQFQLLRAKLRARLEPPDQAAAQFRAALADKKYGSEAAARYGLTYALYRAGDYGQAEQSLALLRKAAPPNAIVDTLAARLKEAEGDAKAALALYRDALARFPDHRALIYGYVRVLLHDKDDGGAVKFLTDQLQYHPDDPHLYQLQAQAYAAQGKNLLQHQALAEAYVRLGNVPAAIEQLQIGLRSGDGDFYQVSGAEARLKALRALDGHTRNGNKDGRGGKTDTGP